MLRSSFCITNDLLSKSLTHALFFDVIDLMFVETQYCLVRNGRISSSPYRLRIARLPPLRLMSDQPDQQEIKQHVEP